MNTVLNHQAQVTNKMTISGVTTKAIRNPKMDQEVSNDKNNGKLSVLVVEDTPLNQKFARIILEDLGYEVDIAINGSQALTMFNNSYTFILMDIELPDMDGIEITKQIRQKNENIPIIACTASGESYKSKCLSSGMNDFILKPLRAEDLNRILNQYIKN